jgi:hypothetical protein
VESEICGMPSEMTPQASARRPHTHRKTVAVLSLDGGEDRDLAAKSPLFLWICGRRHPEQQDEERSPKLPHADHIPTGKRSRSFRWMGARTAT